MLPDGSLVAVEEPGRARHGDRRRGAAHPVVRPRLRARRRPAARSTTCSRIRTALRAGVEKQSWVDGALRARPRDRLLRAGRRRSRRRHHRGWNAHLEAGEPYDGDPAAAARSSTRSPRTTPPTTSTTRSRRRRSSSTTRSPTTSSPPTRRCASGGRRARSTRRPRSRSSSPTTSAIRARASRGDMATAGARVGAALRAPSEGHGRPAPPALETYTQACGGSTGARPVHAAADWDAIHPGEVRFATRRARRRSTRPAATCQRAVVDPVDRRLRSCRTFAATSADDADAATLPPAGGDRRRVHAHGLADRRSPTSRSAARSARSRRASGTSRPNGQQALVAQAPLPAAERRRRDPQVFQLHPNGWHFAAPATSAKLELLGQSAPYGRASNGTFTRHGRRTSSCACRSPRRRTAGRSWRRRRRSSRRMRRSPRTPARPRVPRRPSRRAPRRAAEASRSTTTPIRRAISSSGSGRATASPGATRPRRPRSASVSTTAADRSSRARPRRPAVSAARPGSGRRRAGSAAGGASRSPIPPPRATGSAISRCAATGPARAPRSSARAAPSSRCRRCRSRSRSRSSSSAIAADAGARRSAHRRRRARARRSRTAPTRRRPRLRQPPLPAAS